LKHSQIILSKLKDAHAQTCGSNGYFVPNAKEMAVSGHATQQMWKHGIYHTTYDDNWAGRTDYWLSCLMTGRTGETRECLTSMQIFLPATAICLDVSTWDSPEVPITSEDIPKLFALQQEIIQSFHLEIICTHGQLGASSRGLGIRADSMLPLSCTHFVDHHHWPRYLWKEEPLQTASSDNVMPLFTEASPASAQVNHHSLQAQYGLLDDSAFATVVLNGFSDQEVTALQDSAVNAAAESPASFLNYQMASQVPSCWICGKRSQSTSTPGDPEHVSGSSNIKRSGHAADSWAKEKQD
jgi:hypothetical protein